MNQTILASALAAVSLSLAAPAFAGPVLDKVKANDVVVCGVNTAAPGFSNADSKGNWTGLDVDYCRALAAAVLGDANKVKFVPLNSPQRFKPAKLTSSPEIPPGTSLATPLSAPSSSVQTTMTDRVSWFRRN